MLYVKKINKHPYKKNKVLLVVVDLNSIEMLIEGKNIKPKNNINTMF